MKRAKEYQKAFQEKNFDLDDNDGMFIPQKKAKHRHPDLANFGVEGITQETESPTPGTNMDVDDSPFQDEEEEVPRRSNPLRPVQQMQYNFGTDNPPLLAFLHGFKITTCFGCKNKFGVNLKNPPEDLIVKMPVKRDRLINQKWVTGWKNSWGYFHLSVNCLKLVRSLVEIDDIYIPNDIRTSLTQAHIDKLKKMGWWGKMKRRF